MIDPHPVAWPAATSVTPGPASTPDRAHVATGPWRLLGPEGMVETRGACAPALRALPVGTAVCLVEDRALARWRLRRLARRAGIVVERELIVLPRVSAPIVVLDDARESVTAFWQRIAAVPPGVARAHALADLAVRAARLLPWRVTGAVAPGRVLIGRRR